MRFFPGFFLLFFLAGVASRGAETGLSLAPSNPVAVDWQESPPGTWQAKAKSSPLVVLATPAANPAAEAEVIEFEYFCEKGTGPWKLLPGPPFVPAQARPCAGPGASEKWTPFATRMEKPAEPWPATWSQLRIEIPLATDQTIQLRNLRLRPARPGEFAPKPAGNGAEFDAFLTGYLQGHPPGRVERVVVRKDTVEINGTAGPNTNSLQLAEIPMDRASHDPARFEVTAPVKADPNCPFQLTLPRHRPRDGLDYDRLLSKWQLVRPGANGLAMESHARYADEVECRSPSLPPARPKSKKGLGGWSPRPPPLDKELEDLDIASVTVNLMVQSVIALDPGPGRTPVAWQGRTFYAQDKALAGFDAAFRRAAQHGAMVSVIVLVPNPAHDRSPLARRIGHPDAHPEGTFSMPNVCDPDGLAVYGAAINLLAERYSRPDGAFGRVHHWIIHNEVDAGWSWTNCGEKSADAFMDLYHRSMRMVHLIARQYDPNSRSFISLTHHWARPGGAHFYGSRPLLERLVQWSRAEGDFAWAVAYHPYPQSLFHPRTWEDKEPTFSFDSPKITPRNLEVLDAWMKLPAMRFRGQEVRPVHLSENGFNSMDYTEASLRDQAAGMAYAWKKIQRLDSIQAWQYHNWIDNRHEGGLRIGLRKFPDEPGDPCGRKPIWSLYQALATPREDAACEPYRAHIGLPDWSAALFRGSVK